MATKAPDFGQQMNTSNFSAYVKQGVVDKSEAIQTQADFNLATAGIGVAYDVYSAYDKSRVLGGISQKIDELAKEQAGRSLVGMETQRQDILNQRDQINKTLQESDYNGSYPLNLNTSLNKQVVELRDSLMEKTDRFVKAKEQGVMSDYELSERLSALYREEAMRNPAYANDIKAHIGTLEDMYNLKKRVAYDKAAIDAQGESTKKLQTYVIDQIKAYPSLKLSDYLDENLQFTQKGLQDAITDIEQKTSAKALYEQVERDVKLADLNTQEAQQYILNNNLIPIYAKGSYTVAELSLNDIFRNVDPNNAAQVAKATSDANSFMIQHIRKFKDTYAAARGNATINTLLNDHENDLKALQANIQKFSDGTYTSETLDRALKVQKAFGETEFYKAMGPEKVYMIEFATKIFGKEGFDLDRLSANGKKDVVNKIYEMMLPAGQQLLRQFGIEPDDKSKTGESEKTKSDRKKLSEVGFTEKQLNALDEKGKNVVETMHNNTVKLATTDPDNAKHCTTLECMFDISLATIKDTTLNESTRFKHHESLIDRASGDGMLPVFSKMDPGTRTGLRQAVDSYNQVLVRDMQRDQLDNQTRSYKFSIDGFGYVMPDDPSNRQYASRMNKALGAYANTVGKTRSEVAQEFMEKYYPSQISGIAEKPDSAVNIETQGQTNDINTIMDKIAMVESGNKHMDEKGNLIVNSVSKAMGKYQILPTTAKDPGFGVQPLQNNTEEEHRRFATDYFNAMLREFENDQQKALAAYNVGPDVLKKAIQQDPQNWLSLLPKETRDYVAKITKGSLQKK